QDPRANVKLELAVVVKYQRASSEKPHGRVLRHVSRLCEPEAAQIAPAKVEQLEVLDDRLAQQEALRTGAYRWPHEVHRGHRVLTDLECSAVLPQETHDGFTIPHHLRMTALSVEELPAARNLRGQPPADGCSGQYAVAGECLQYP